MSQKLTKREQDLAARAGGGKATARSREFVLARRKRPGLTLLEFEAESGKGPAAEVDVTSTTDPAGGEPAAAKKTTAKKAASAGTSAS